MPAVTRKQLQKKRNAYYPSNLVDNGTFTVGKNNANRIITEFNNELTNDLGAVNPTVYVVFTALLLDLLAFTMILPLFPALLEFYRVNDKRGLYDSLSQSIKYFQEFVGAPEKYNSVLFGGFLGSMFSFLQFAVSPIVGGLSDVYGRKPLMLICCIGIALSYLLWAYSNNFAIFVLARFIGGLSKGNVSLSMAILTDITNVRTRAYAMALVGIAFSLGFIFGPTIGAVFTLYSNTTSTKWFWFPAMSAFFLIIADFIFLAYYFKETLPKWKRSKEVVTSLSYAMNFLKITSIFNFKAVKNLPENQINSLRQLGFLYFIYLFIYSGLEFTVTFLMFHKFNYTTMDQAVIFLTTGVIMAILQGGVVRRLKPTGVKKFAVFGLYLISPAFIFVGIADGTIIFYLGMILFAISTAFVVPCITTLVSKYGSFDQKGAVLGIFRSLGALARASGPVVASMAFWSLGSTITYIVGGILLLYPAVLLKQLDLQNC